MALFTAIKDNNIDEVQKLAPVYWNGYLGKTTPLLYACKHCRLECIQILAPYDNLNQFDDGNLTPLNHMVWYCKPIQVELLLKLGANPNMGNSLWTAVALQDTNIVSLLLNYGT